MITQYKLRKSSAAVFSQMERGMLLQHSSLMAYGQHTRRHTFDAELRNEETGRE